MAIVTVISLWVLLFRSACCCWGCCYWCLFALLPPTAREDIDSCVSLTVCAEALTNSKNSQKQQQQIVCEGVGKGKGKVIANNHHHSQQQQQRYKHES
jgi:hypothetical protein